MQQNQTNNESSILLLPEVVAALLAHQAAASSEDRLGLCRNPKGYIEKLTEQTLPDKLSIKLHTNNDDCWHIVYPSKSNELSDNDLEDLAAGEFVFGIIGIASAVALAALAISGGVAAALLSNGGSD